MDNTYQLQETMWQPLQRLKQYLYGAIKCVLVQYK